uniref:Uncharacterized protein n=1 Tax=Thermosporothrix sp. COM3 TaxID=2490863 RepID=A0A455SC76_9CHLR|nr:hypothetical protein KTC_07980 [Thermosporothrix sp. COM3]
MGIYHLDLMTIVDTFSNHPITLQTSLPDGVPGTLIKDPCVGIVYAQGGVITSSAITGPNGVILKGDPALDILLQIHIWNVTVGAESNEPTQPPPVPVEEAIPQPIEASPARSLISSPIPVRQSSYLPEQFAGRTSRERVVLRTIFMLIDGKRSIDDLKGQLHLPPQVIEGALEALRQVGLIYFKEE